jgi:hypothetical protein
MRAAAMPLEDAKGTPVVHRIKIKDDLCSSALDVTWLWLTSTIRSRRGHALGSRRRTTVNARRVQEGTINPTIARTNGGPSINCFGAAVGGAGAASAGPVERECGSHGYRRSQDDRNRSARWGRNNRHAMMNVASTADAV